MPGLGPEHLRLPEQRTARLTGCWPVLENRTASIRPKPWGTGPRLFTEEGDRVMIVRLVIGILVGGLLGYGVYRFIGCSSGACPITSNPWVSTIVGMVFGALLSRAI